MTLHQVGQTIDGHPLMGEYKNGVRIYQKNEKLVAVAYGNLEDQNQTRYACLSGVWEPDSQTTIVNESQLADLCSN